MSQEAGAGINTVSQALTNELLEDPNGRIPLVAPEGRHHLPDFPNSELSGAQPDISTPASEDGDSAPAYQARHAWKPVPHNPDLADMFEYSVRYQHIPDAPI